MIIPFDQYQRYMHATDLINAVREEGQVFSILEVGANEHKNLERFLLNDRVTYLDIVVPEHLKHDPSYIEGDATNMPLEDNKFDFIIALDVFEHISDPLRGAFVSELMRVSKYGFILAAPFNTPGVEESEIRANKYFETMYGFNYQWLEEHRENGLPEIQKLVSFLEDNQWSYLNFSHGSLKVWEKMIKIHFLAAGRSSLYDYRATIDDYYNNYIYNVDYDEPSYRNFFFVSSNLEKLAKAKAFVTGRSNQGLDPAVFDKLSQLENDLINLSSYDLTHREYMAKNDELIQKEKQINSIKDELNIQVKRVEELNGEVERLSRELANSVRALRAEEEQNTISVNTAQQEIAGLQEEVSSLQQSLAARDNYIAQLEHISQQLRIKNRVKKLVPQAIRSKAKLSLSIIRKLKQNPSLAKKGIREIRHSGLRSLNNKIQSVVTVEELTSEYVSQEISIEDTQYMKAEIELFHKKPLISIVIPVYNVAPKWLDLAIESVKNQIYPYWEICITDDCSTNEETIQYLEGVEDSRINIVRLERNSGISNASNKAVSIGTGEYIALLDNDDEIAANALFEVVRAINECDADILYSDEDKVDIHGIKKNPLHKPDWSPDLLRSQMYIGHFLVFTRDLFNKVGGFRAEFNGSQDYDLVLRMTEIARQIHHIPKVLYSWRELDTSTAANPYAKPYAHTAGLAALNEHLTRVFGPGNAYATEDEYLFVYDTRYRSELVKVSIIIPTKDKVELLEPCISSILQKTSYPDYEILIINNNSIEKETFDWFEQQKSRPAVRIIDANYEFNWSKLNNHGIREAAGDVYVFLNNDTLIISEDWLERLVEKTQREDVGTVGGLLLYEDHTIQHAGVVIGLGGWADHIFKGMKPNHFGSPYISPMVTRNVTASTGACLAISQKALDKIGLFNEEFIICGSDVEISLRSLEHGLVNIYDPHVKLFHLESKSRSSYIPPIDFELSKFFYGPYLEKGDPYFNKNLSLNSLAPKLSQGDR
ncbi:glycosyltransferase [Paenibacillus tianjinensis]|uniref:Glycosyltransferase n=1 Tax=Paenibacillus tianjinensis TaxID=2810347 RepID=A0ABX7LFF7_9BACL|nr:glycosyltransferase [Paenibacillus tianjinensis]QSF44672.1 glycosyltransferase [Paenibacillus tianjinensis]